MLKKKIDRIISIEEAILISYNSFENGVHPKIIAKALLEDNFSPSQIATIMRWTLVKVKQKKSV